MQNAKLMSLCEGMAEMAAKHPNDKISNALVKNGHVGCLNPFMVFNELESGLKHQIL
jgi:serine protein kinase